MVTRGNGALCVLRGLIGFFLLTLIPTTASWATFEREFELQNRREFRKVLDSFDQEIQLRIEADEKEADIEEGLVEEEELEGEEAEEVTIFDLLDIRRFWRFRSSGEVGFARDTNVFGERIDARSEVVYTYSPTIEAYTGVRPWSLNTAYTMTYHDHKNFNHNDRFDHEWKTDFSLAGNRLSGGVSNTLSVKSFPTESGDEKGALGRSNSLQATLAIKMAPKTSVVVQYGNNYSHFLSDTRHGSDSITHRFRTDIRYQWTGKTALFGGLERIFYRFPKTADTSDLDQETLHAGIVGRLGSKLYMSVDGTINLTNSNDPEIKNRRTYEGNAALRYPFSRKLGFGLSYQRADVPAQTKTANDPLNQTVALAANYRMTPRIGFSAVESIRWITDPEPTTVTDPDNPAIITTKGTEELHLGTDLGMTYAIGDDWALSLDYSFIRVRSNLKLANRTRHITSFIVERQF